MSHHFLRFKDVHYRYPDGYEALRGVSFEITHGQKVAVVGANGAGKSTLLLHADGFLMPSSGEVDVGGMTLSHGTLPHIRRSVGFVFQDSDNQLFMPTVAQDVAFGPCNMGLAPEQIESRVCAALSAVDALHLRDRAPYTLSGGQKKRVAIATVLSMEPSVLVMDEPTSNLDSVSRRRIIELIRGFTHTTVIATHDLDMVAELCPRTMVMHRGKIVADDSTDRIFADAGLLAACGLEPPRAVAMNCGTACGSK